MSSRSESLAGFQRIPGTGTFPVIAVEAVPDDPRFQRIVKKATETISSDSTLSDDAELKFDLKAFEEVTVYVNLLVNSGTTPDFKKAWTVPTGAVGFHTRSLTAAAEGLSDASVIGTSGSDQNVYSLVTIHNGETPGTVVMQWAQNTSDASDTKVLAGSYLLVRRER